MPPLKKAPRTVDRGRAPYDNFAQQAGRSLSSLGVERDTAVFTRDSPRTTSLLYSPETPTPQSRPRKPSVTIQTPNTPGFPAQKKGTFVPPIPSPLVTSSSATSVSSVETGHSNGFGTPRASTSQDLPRQKDTGNLQMKPMTGKKTVAVNPIPTAQVSSSPPSAGYQSGTPKALSDLGRDYSRYPDSSPHLPLLNSNSRAHSSSGPLYALGSSSTVSVGTQADANPFLDSNATGEAEKQWYPDDSLGGLYFGTEKSFMLYPEDIEEDDQYHMPKDDDDQNDKPKWQDFFDRRNVVNSIGAAILILGLVCIFILLPVLTYTGLVRPYIPSQTDDKGTGTSGSGPAWAHINDLDYPLLKNTRSGLIDPDTPQSAYTRTSTFDGSQLQLVFSDEFNDNNRTFYPGDDPFWTAPDIWYGATQDLEWYDPDAVTTYEGTLQLRMDQFPNHNLQFRSGMLNSWNQICFKGGVFEVSVSLAGPAGNPGMWPGVWTMGNLGRPGYKASTEGVWPYTYDSCDVGITPNQSSSDGLSYLPGQKLSSCTCSGEDHPTPGTGRGAPEIDVLEGSVDPNNKIGVVTQSLQVAPFDLWWHPDYAFTQIPNYDTTSMNGYCGGPFQQAVSATTLLNNDWYDGNAYQKYAFEYIPGTTDGKLAWFVGDDESFMISGNSIRQNGNVNDRLIPEEPMSMVLNLGISNAWTGINWPGVVMPTVMHIDYVRWYQDPNQVTVTCDPEGYETTEYIANHPTAYMNPNLTAWNETGYEWPKNSFMHEC